MSILWWSTSIAANDQSIGKFATELMEPVGILSDFVSTTAFIIGFSCLFASFLRFMQYRVNPLASPISTVIVLFVLGIVLLCLPFTYLLIGTGIPFPHEK
jgi:hypothetical protein